jgi:hypothetical protein
VVALLIPVLIHSLYTTGWSLRKHRFHDRRVYGSFGEPESRTLASAEPLGCPADGAASIPPMGPLASPVGTTVCPDDRPWAYALDIAAWAVCQACNTSAGSRPRSLTLWPFFLAHSRIDFSVSRL